MAKFIYERGFFKIKKNGIRILFFKEYETTNSMEIELLRQLKVKEVQEPKQKNKKETAQ